MYLVTQIALHERGVLYQHGLPIGALGPSKHVRWGLGLHVEKLDTRALVVDLPDEVRAVLGEGAFGEARLAAHERGVLFRRGRPEVFLRPGQHRFWAVDPSVELHVFDTGEPVPDVTDELLAILPKTDVVQAVVLEYQRAILYVNGRFERALEPGRYAFWTRAGAPVAVRLVDMRRQQLAIAGQELLTRDKVTLRLTVAVDWAPAEPETAPHTVVDAEATLYTLVQLALREHVAAVSLDELLEGRDALTAFLEARTVAEALGFGVRILQLGVKDVILPGEMRALMNRVIEAEKQAAANVILRREEAAATRALANAAKVMADNPVLLRLKELEAVERIAGQVGELKLHLGADGVDTIRRLLTAGE